MIVFNNILLNTKENKNKSICTHYLTVPKNGAMI